MAADKNPSPSSNEPLVAPRGGAPTETAPAEETVDTKLVDHPAIASMSKAVYDAPDSDTTLYRVPFLNASFAILSFVLLVLTIWAIWQDYSREWKYYQFEWQDYQANQFEAELEAERAEIQDERERLEAKLADLEPRIERDGSIEELEARVKDIESDANILETKAKFLKARMDEAKFSHEKTKEKVLLRLGDTAGARARIGELEEAFQQKWIIPYERALADAQQAAVDAAEARAHLEARRQTYAQLQSERAALVRELNLVKKNLDDVETNAKNTIRNLPLLDFFQPSAQIHKVVVNDLTEPLNFVDVPRVDRCKSCHVNIDNPSPAHDDLVMEDTPHEGKVFRSHPRLDLFVGSSSPHPYNEFGCTICHYGDGHSLTFTTTSHTPATDEQAEEWEEKYHWHKMHHQDYPMLPQPYITGTCAKCHTEESRIVGADKWNQGRQLVEEYGCFGCHKIEGFEDYRRVGPNLRHIASKVSSDFLYKWIRNPTDFRPTTRMPLFFDLANSTGSIEVIGFGGRVSEHPFERRNGIEALAMARYLESVSEPYDTKARYQFPAGVTPDPEDAEQVARGREAFKTSGCLGCHAVESEEDRAFHQNRHGPDLSTVGSKLDADWLADWIVQPWRYYPETRMPRLRIEEDENGDQKLADIVSYLLSLRAPEFEEQPAFSITAGDREILKDIAYDYQTRTTTRPEAREAVEAWYSGDDPDEGDEQALVYIGENLIRRYGCFGCHNGIEGFEDAQPIGVELSTHGAKDPLRLDFGYWGHQPNGEFALPKTRIAWFTKKLENTRIYDMLPVRRVDREGHVTYAPSSKRLEKNAEELLKMPLFAFHDDAEKVEAVVTFLVGLLPDPIPLSKQRVLQGDDQVIEDGRRLVRDMNCQGCHRIGVDTDAVPLSHLPIYSFDDPPEKTEFNELERETWIADEIKLEAYKSADGKIDLPEMVFPKHTFLSQRFLYPIAEIDEEPDEYALSQILGYYWKTTGLAPHNRVVNVQGFREGKVRLAFGATGEDRALAPPLLRRQGQRVNPEWLFNFLLNVEPLRPWLSIRMPSYHFTTEESRAIVEMFRVMSDVPGPHEKFEAHQYFPEIAAAGKEIFVSAQEADLEKNPPPLRLGCDACHPAGNRLPTNPDKTNWGPDLGMARARLRPTWVGGWLAQPGAFMPGTKMPSFWFSVDNFAPPDAPEVLQGIDREYILELVPWLKNQIVLINGGREDWRTEMDRLLQYLMHMSKVDDDRGMASE